MSHQDPFAGRSMTCIACRRDPGLKHWHFEGDLLCWRCWQRVEHLGNPADPGDAIAVCRLFRAEEGEVECLSARDYDELAALGLVTCE